LRAERPTHTNAIPTVHALPDLLQRAASLVLFGVWGLWICLLTFSAALCLNRADTLRYGISLAFVVVIFELLITGVFMPPEINERKAGRRTQCMNNLKQIGLALHIYHQHNGHFPPAQVVDETGTPLFSWRVDVLPMFGFGAVYDALKKDELWNGPHNEKLLGQFAVNEFTCPSDVRDEDDFTTNYVAVIGPGTAWREDGPVKLSDLPDGGSHTVMLVEVANSGVHWAEPRDLTVDEALDRMRSGTGLGISSGHPGIINVLFANGAVRLVTRDMPISVWRRLFAGEIKDVDNIEAEVAESAADVPDFSYPPRERKFASVLRIWPYVLSFVVWLFSVVLLFRRAIKSRRKPAAESE